MIREQLIQTIFEKGSFLCVGLDTDINKIPVALRDRPDAIVAFNKAIIDATKHLCVSYKINTAFYESSGVKGWAAMEETVNYIPATHFRIADAKRGDIGNTSSHYAKAFFETMPFDAVTVAPYMGEDSVRPFLEYEGKWTILLALTSNAGSKDFQQKSIGQQALYEEVLDRAMQWGSEDNLMFVVGATKAAQLQQLRQKVPQHFLLIPGVGAQGGSLEEVAANGLTADCGLLVNVSRGIIYAGQGEDFADAARKEAERYQQEMNTVLSRLSSMSL